MFDKVSEVRGLEGDVEAITAEVEAIGCSIGDSQARLRNLEDGSAMRTVNNGDNCRI